MGKKYKTGITFSGGGARAFAHIGMLKSLLENDIRPDVVSGGSTGALVACLYADGYSPDEILPILKEVSLVNLFTPSLSINSLFKDKRYVHSFKKHFRSTTLDKLDIPVFVSCIDFLEGELHFFSSGDIITALEASIAIPVLYKPVQIGDRFYCDGGALSNLPVEGIKDDCEFLIGLNVNPLRPVKNIGNLRDVAERTVRLVVTPNIKAGVPSCDLFMEPDELANYSLLDFNKADEMFQIGYQFGIKKIQEWQNDQQHASRY